MQHQKHVRRLTPRHQHRMSLLPAQLGTCIVLLPPSAGSEKPPADNEDTLSTTNPVMMMSAASHIVGHWVAYALRSLAIQPPSVGHSVCAQQCKLIRGSVTMPQGTAGLCLVIQVPGLVQTATFPAPGIEHPVHTSQFLSASLSWGFPHKKLHHMFALSATAGMTRLTIGMPSHAG